MHRLLAPRLGRQMRLSGQCHAAISSTVSQAGPKRRPALTFAGPWLSLIEDFRDLRVMLEVTPNCPAKLPQMQRRQLVDPPLYDNPH